MQLSTNFDVPGITPYLLLTLTEHGAGCTLSRKRLQFVTQMSDLVSPELVMMVLPIVTQTPLLLLVVHALPRPIKNKKNGATLSGVYTTPRPRPLGQQDLQTMLRLILGN
jgi:hypothetical protein